MFPAHNRRMGESVYPVISTRVPCAARQSGGISFLFTQEIPLPTSSAFLLGTHIRGTPICVFQQGTDLTSSEARSVPWGIHLFGTKDLRVHRAEVVGHPDEIRKGTRQIPSCILVSVAPAGTIFRFFSRGTGSCREISSRQSALKAVLTGLRKSFGCRTQDFLRLTAGFFPEDGTFLRDTACRYRERLFSVPGRFPAKEVFRIKKEMVPQQIYARWERIVT